MNVYKGLCAVILLGHFVSANALQSVIQAKDKLQIVEQTDGYLGLIDQYASHDVKQMMKDINKIRRMLRKSNSKLSESVVQYLSQKKYAEYTVEQEKKPLAQDWFSPISPSKQAQKKPKVNQEDSLTRKPMISQAGGSMQQVGAKSDEGSMQKPMMRQDSDFVQEVIKSDEGPKPIMRKGSDSVQGVIKSDEGSMQKPIMKQDSDSVQGVIKSGEGSMQQPMMRQGGDSVQRSIKSGEAPLQASKAVSDEQMRRPMKDDRSRKIGATLGDDSIVQSGSKPKHQPNRKKQKLELIELWDEDEAGYE